MDEGGGDVSQCRKGKMTVQEGRCSIVGECIEEEEEEGERGVQQVRPGR